MPLTTPARHLHIIKDHDAGRMHAEWTTFAGSGTLTFNGGTPIPIYHLEMNEVIMDEPMDQRPDRDEVNSPRR